MNYYNETSNNYNELHGEEQISKAKIILKELLKKKSKGLLLDIGGGTGIATELFTENYDCILVDPSEKLLEQAPPQIIKILGEAEEIPFSDKKFNIIISITSLHHADLKLAIKEIKRVATPEAIIAISFLKTSKKLKEFEKLFKKEFINFRTIEEDKDLIFFNFY